MADGAGMAGAPLDVSGRKPGAAGGIHAVDSDAAVVVDAVHAAQGVRVVDSSGLNHILPVEAGQTLAQTIWLSGISYYLSHNLHIEHIILFYAF